MEIALDRSLTQSLLYLDGVTVSFDGFRALNKLSLQIDVENISDRVYRIAQEGEFAPAQFSIPRLISATAKIRF